MRGHYLGVNDINDKPALFSSFLTSRLDISPLRGGDKPFALQLMELLELDHHHALDGINAAAQHAAGAALLLLADLCRRPAALAAAAGWVRGVVGNVRTLSGVDDEAYERALHVKCLVAWLAKALDDAGAAAAAVGPPTALASRQAASSEKPSYSAVASGGSRRAAPSADHRVRPSVDSSPAAPSPSHQAAATLYSFFASPLWPEVQALARLHAERDVEEAMSVLEPELLPAECRNDYYEAVCYACRVVVSAVRASRKQRAAAASSSASAAAVDPQLLAHAEAQVAATAAAAAQEHIVSLSSGA